MTFLFCDMVGSTDLLSRHGLDVSETARVRLFAALREAIAATDGEEVKSLGDGVMVAFPRSTADAVACAVAMQRAVGRLNLEQPGLPLAIRVGVSMGPATPADDDWYGTPVNVAARLCAAAGTGQVYVSATVADVLDLGPDAVRTVGELALKGIPEPHPTISVVIDEDLRSPAPWPTALDVEDAWPFLGRSDELAQLRAAWTSSRSGAQLVTVVGEPGVGVSRLMRTFARSRAAEGALILFAASTGDEADPLAPLARAVRWYVAVAPVEELAADLGALAPDLELVVPSLRARLARAPRSVAPARRSPAAALERLISAAASRTPVLLVLDDAHGAPPETRALLTSLAASDAGLLVLCGERLGGARRPLPGATIELAGLDADAVADLVGHIAGPVDARTVDAVVAATRGNPRHVTDVARSLATLAASGSASVETVIDHACPYRGLFPFRDADHTLFFGRDDQVAAVIDRLAARRWVTVVGASGSGKSSLVRAGVLPALRRGALPGSERWHQVTVIPGARPRHELARALSRLDDVDDGVEAIAAELDDVDGLDRVARRLVGDARLVVVVDQFEELFVSTPEHERQRFLDLVLRATASPGGPTTIVAAVRADFYGHLAEVPGLAPALEQGHVLLGPMDEAQLAQSVTGPAFVAGLRLESGLAETIVADVAGQPGALPLLSHALLETWRRRQGRTLTLSAYREVGGVRGAIARTAESVHDALTAPDRHRLRELFARLVTPGDGVEDTRRRAARRELPDGLLALLPGLVTARLITTDGDTVEVAHEALIREWPRLRGWLDDDREALRVHRHLTAAAGAWASNGGDAAELYGDARLAQVEEWIRSVEPTLNREEQDFVVASRARVRSRARRRTTLVASLAVLASLAAIAAGVAVVQQRRATTNARAAEANAATARVSADEARASAAKETEARTDAELRRLAFQAQTVAASQPDVAMLLAVETYRRRPDLEALGALQGALTGQPAITRFVSLGLPADQAASNIAVGGGVAAVTASSPSAATVILLDAASLTPTGVVLDVGGLVSLVVRPDGAEIATASNDGPVRRWSTATGRESAPPIAATPWERSGITRPLAYLDDGSLVVAEQKGIRRYGRASSAVTGQVSLDGEVTALAFDGATGVLAVGYGSLFERRYALRLLDARTLTPRGPDLDLQVDFAAVEANGTLVTASFPADFRASVTRVDLAAGVIATGPRPLPTMPLAVASLPDGRIVVELISGDLLPLDADLAPGTAQSTGLGIAAPVAVGPNGHLLTASGGRLVELDADGRTALGVPLVVDGAPLVGTVAGDAGGRRLLVVGPDGARIRDASDLQPVGPPLAPTLAPLLGTMSLSPDGTRVGVTGLDRTEILDAATGQPLWAPVPGGGIVPPSFSPDGATAVTGGLDSIVRLLDVATGRERWRTDLGGFNVAVPPLWSPDGSRIALFANGVGTVVLDATNGTVTGPPFLGTNFAFSPDGRHGVLFGTDLQTIELATGAVTPLPGNRGLFSGAYVDASTILGVSLGGFVSLVDVATGRQVGNRFRVSGDILTQSPSFAFDPVRRQLYVGRRNGTIARYSLATTEWDRLACRAAGRDLTPDEWATYLAALGPYRETCA